MTIPLFLRRHWPVLVLGCASAAMYVREILEERPFVRDTHLLFVPGKAYLAALLNAGELPMAIPVEVEMIVKVRD